MDAVGHILASRDREPFPWGLGASLALLLHAGIAGSFLISGLAHQHRYLATRTVAVRLIQAGTLRGGAQQVSVPQPEPEKPRIVKPAEETPPPPTEKAKLLPSPEKKKQPPVQPQAPTQRQAAPPAASSSAESARAGRGGAAGAGGDVGIGGATFDQPDFNYSYYAARIQVLIGINWFKPVAEVRVTPVVHFRIARDGTISDAEITTSSGLPFVDRAALRAVLASSPLPPLPAEFPGSFVGTSVGFE